MIFFTKERTALIALAVIATFLFISCGGGNITADSPENYARQMLAFQKQIIKVKEDGDTDKVRDIQRRIVDLQNKVDALDAENRKKYEDTYFVIKDY